MNYIQAGSITDKKAINRIMWWQDGIWTCKRVTWWSCAGTGKDPGFDSQQNLAWMFWVKEFIYYLKGLSLTFRKINQQYRGCSPDLQHVLQNKYQLLRISL